MVFLKYLKHQNNISHELEFLVIRQLYDSREIERNLIDSDSTVSSKDFIHIYNIEPLEDEIPSLRVTLNKLVTNEDYSVMRLQELELLDEKIKATFDHMRVCQKILSKTYNKKVHPREFLVGDLVLCENSKNQKNRAQKGKFEPNWLGPFIIIVAFGLGAYLLSTLEGDQLPDPINVLHLKKALFLMFVLVGGICTYLWVLIKSKKSDIFQKYKNNYKRKNKIKQYFSISTTVFLKYLKHQNKVS